MIERTACRYWKGSLCVREKGQAMSEPSLLRPPRLRSAAPLEERHATWLELFYDLVLAAAVSQISQGLNLDPSPKGLAVFTGLFIPIWWIWAGHTVYATRFDTDDFIYRLLTFLQMFAVIGMAVAGPARSLRIWRGLRSGLSGGARNTLSLLARAFYHVPEARRFNSVYLIGFGAGASIWAASLFLESGAQFILWGISLTIELATPWYVWVRKDPLTSVSASHIPERLGLFTIIVLGESLFADVRGLTEQHWEIRAFLSAFLGFLLAVCVWWIYFRHLERAIGRIKLWSGQPYIYSHFPLLAGIIIMSAGLLNAIIESGLPSLPDGTIILLWGGFFMWLAAGFLLHNMTNPAEARASAFRYLGMLAAVWILAALSLMMPPVVTVGTMPACALSLLYLDICAHARAARKEGG